MKKALIYLTFSVFILGMIISYDIIKYDGQVLVKNLIKPKNEPVLEQAYEYVPVEKNEVTTDGGRDFFGDSELKVMEAEFEDGEDIDDSYDEQVLDDFSEEDSNRGYEYYFDLLNSEEKKIYRAMYEAFSNIESGNAIPTVNEESMNRVAGYIRLDHPEFFYAKDLGYTHYTMGGQVVKTVLAVSYTESKASIKSQMDYIDRMADELIASIPADADDYTKAKTVRIVKPYADNGKVRDQFAYAESVGAFGIGMDIDHIFGPEGEDIVIGEKMAVQTFDMLQSYVQSTKLPFVIKGVLSVEDAVKCADIGASAIIVSHHHGRLPYAVPPMMILPEIKEALDGRNVKIIVDCGISSGADVYKALAFGADAAAVGRSMLPALEAEGTKGVIDFVEEVRKELRFIMSCTGYAKVQDMDDRSLVKKL